MVAEMIKNGQIVPSEITVGLLQTAMKESGKVRCLPISRKNHELTHITSHLIAGRLSD